MNENNKYIIGGSFIFLIGIFLFVGNIILYKNTLNFESLNLAHLEFLCGIICLVFGVDIIKNEIKITLKDKHEEQNHKGGNE